MMKVSFKGDFKKVRKLDDRTTEVTLTGTIHLPDAWQLIPQSINDWIAWRSYASSISTDFNAANETMIIKVKGRAKRHPKDEDNIVIAERIAESRAKIRLYRFMHTLIGKLCAYYYALVYGKQGEATSNFVAPHDETSFYVAYKKYESLLIKESHHLGKLIEDL